MRHLLDEFSVGIVLFAGFSYALYSLGPRALRARLLAWMAASLRALPAFLRLRALGGRLAATAAKTSAGSCGGCEKCGAGQAAAPATSTPAVSAAEIRVPLTAIAMRRALPGRRPPTSR